MVSHPSTASAAIDDATREFPKAPPGGRRTPILFEALPCGVHDLAWYARVGHGHGDPLVLGLCRAAGFSAVHPPVLGHLLSTCLSAVKPPKAVKLGLVQPGCYLR